MIVRKMPTGELVFLDEKGEREIFRVRPPKEGFTIAELEGFIERLKKEVKVKEIGPN